MKLTLADLKERTDRVQVDDIDFDAFRDDPLDAATLRCLRYMHDVEHNTIIYLRDVLVTDAHLDHEITSFLTFWAFEEYFHGEAISQVLEAHGEPGSDARVPVVRRPTLHDRVLPLSTMVATHLTRQVPTVHMTWGAVNEWTAQAAYGRLAAKAGHPTLSKLLHRIMKQEGRHIDFYASQATAAPRGQPPRPEGHPLGAATLLDSRRRRHQGSGRGAVHGAPPVRRRRRPQGGRAHRPLHRPPPRPGRPPPREALGSLGQGVVEGDDGGDEEGGQQAALVVGGVRLGSLDGEQRQDRPQDPLGQLVDVEVGPHEP